MNNNIHAALQNLFTRHRIVFWYDTKRELREEFETLLLPGVELIELTNNEFAVKHRLLREQPDQKFLLYRAGPEPEYLDNWLLDIQLAAGVFQADQVALWLVELELPPPFLKIMQAHADFFASEKRRLALKTLLRPPEETETSLRLKMLAICADVEPRLDEILTALLADLAEEQETQLKLIRRSELESFLWEQLKRQFGYQSTAPGVQDFAIALFKASFALGLGQPAALNNDALVFLKKWKDSRAHVTAFEKLSHTYADILNVEAELLKLDYRALAELDVFRLIDQRILSELAGGVVARTLSASDCAALVRQRRRSHWYAAFQDYYETVDYAAQFLKALAEADLTVDSLAVGVQRYTQTWYRLDQLYRLVVYHFRQAAQATLLRPIMDLVENHYTTNYLLPLSYQWQAVVDAAERWQADPIVAQRDFFERFVQPFLNNNKKVYVIISDAFRYEVADELLSRVRSEDRYEAKLDSLLGAVPSYTQLGMAALLPNHTLTFAGNNSDTVLVDGLSTQGTANRDKILKQTVGDATALRAEDLLALSKEDCRALVRDNRVIYVYHNRIDATGDKRESEERVFEAVAETLDELLTIIKKLTAANATNLLVTADHGFIYQHRAIEDSDFSSAEVSGPNISVQERRFVLGRGLPAHPSLKHFSAAAVGLTGEWELQMPKTIQRLRLKGAGSRYVHGGAALQEVVVPLLHINKKRESDLTQVEVEIVRGAGTLITSGQLAVTFYQAQPVNDKVRGRRLRVGLYTLAGVLISDQHTLDFDLTVENPRERETVVRLMLTREAHQANNQEISLRLEEQVAATTHYQEYKSQRYTLRRSFTSDFDL